MRAAIYARMSTDKQSADSPADQIARCREFASTRGWTVADELVVQDAGVSGASRHERPRFLELMANIDGWDELLCWDFSRLARNEEDLGWVRNRLKAAKKDAYAVNTGRSIHDLGSRVEGVIAAEYLEKLKSDTHRGLRGRAERGLSAGGLPYGYRTKELPSGQIDPHGRSIPAGYRFVIDEPQAAVVRRIFELYASGDGLRSIAHRLNAEGIQSPRGKGWSSSALQVMLKNPIYRGEYVWNRSEWIKDHETGKRRRFERPEADWIRQALPDLAIVSEELWNRAQEAAADRGPSFQRDAVGQIIASAIRVSPTRHALSGFLECATCGGSFFALTKTERYGCGWHRDRGPDVCPSTLRVARTDLEARVFGAIRDQVLVPDGVAYAVQCAVDALAEAMNREDPRQVRARLREIDKELANLARFVAKTGKVDAAAAHYAELDAERNRLLDRLTEPPVFDPEEIRRAAEARVLVLREALAHGPESRAALRALLGNRRLQVGPDPERGFRVDGLLEVEIEAGNGRGSRPGPFARDVAGGCYGTVSPRVVAPWRLAA
jgi:DNA invertase Pin-like site-specific DNA recombinase